MGFLNKLKNTLFHADTTRERAEDEAAFHLEMREQELIARGLSPDQARLEARQRYGNVLAQQEATSDTDVLPRLEAWLRDIRVSARRLSRSPLFLLSSVALLAIGLGVNTAVFSVLDALFLRPLPFNDPASLYVIDEIREGRVANSNPARLADWRARVTAFTAVSSTYGESLKLREGDSSRSVQAIRVCGDWVSLLGAPILAGRNFTMQELSGERVALLSARSRNLAPIGASIRLGSDLYQVIGVVSNTVAPGEDFDVVTPIPAGLLPGSRKAGYLQPVVRLKPGVSAAAAASELASVASQLAREYPDSEKDLRATLVPAQTAWTAEARRPALYVQAAAALLLIITLVNLAGMLAARALERQREDTIRLFLGAGRWHLIRLHLAEAGLVVLLSTIAAGFIAPTLLATLQRYYGDEFAPIRTAQLDLRVLAFLGLTGIIATLLFAAVMAWQTSREADPRGRFQFRFRSALILAQATFGLVLLATAFQLVEDFSNLRFAPLGIREQGLISTRFYLSWSVEEPKLRNAITASQREMLSIPGVSEVAVVDRLPLEGGSQDSPVFIRGRAEKTSETVGIRMASTNYFALMGIPLLAGSLPTDDYSVLVNQAFVRAWITGDPIGREISQSGKNWYRIAGVIGDVRYSTKSQSARPEVFFSERTQYWPMLTFVIRANRPAGELTEPLRQLFNRIEPEGDFRGVTTVTGRLDDLVAQPRHQRNIISVVGLLALLLVIAGVYALMAGEMLRRRREIGIRLAIGATRANIMGIALLRAARLAGLACLLGGGFCVYVLDTWVAPPALAIATATICLSMLFAAWLPAWRGSQADPILALRQD